MVWTLASSYPFERLNGIGIVMFLMFLFGAFFIVSYTLIVIYILIKRADLKEADEIMSRFGNLLLKVLLKGPIHLVALGIIGVAVVAFFGFLASIPLWAAVIILLLLLLLLK